ncbi:hypothetical protein TELCIR_01008 [Teladorsagia circumcincta]|uniref:NPHP4 C2-like domain-containing protein n=1 Tax=Teladorsagia circumcincta TaxID=45464 RepID=A0A2G9V353_TELCI|nr:hypothetical protein TELCIR_01008 [Teladorsagia circumcincta]
MSSNVNDWYGNFLSRRVVPLRRDLPPNAITEGYAVVIRKLRLTKDLFFHCPHLDDAVHLVIEVVETTQDQSQAITVAWGLIAITGYGETILDYTRVPAAFDLQRIKLYPGSPKVLTFSAKSYNESTASGSLECSLYSHARLIDAVDYFPDFCIIGNRDDIPGLLLSETGPQLADPVPMSQVSSTLDEISLSFGPHAERIENLILDDINADRLYRENHAPAVKIDPMQVVERRLRYFPVSLIGGPRPNPEESLCFRNLLHLYRRDDSIFTESAPKITIQFNFALDDTVSGTFVAQLEQITVWTNLQRHYGSLSRSTTQLGDSLRETPAPTRKEIPDVVAVDREAEKPSRRQESRKEDSDAALTDQEEPLPPIITKKPTPITTPILHQKIDRVIEQESPRQNLPVSYALPLKEARNRPPDDLITFRISNVPRSVYAALSNVQFPGIFDREGDPPVLVDVTSTTLPSRAIEINDGLNTNEIIVQFMAFKCLNKYEVPPIRKVFFTLQFYRFQQVTTEELAKFLVDRQRQTEDDRDEFINYLSANSLCIESWDAESLIYLGASYVPLQSLLRCGKEAVQCTVQCPVVFSALPGQPARVVAHLYVRLANIGHPSSNQIEWAFDVKQAERFVRDHQAVQFLTWPLLPEPPLKV